MKEHFTPLKKGLFLSKGLQGNLDRAYFSYKKLDKKYHMSLTFRMDIKYNNYRKYNIDKK